LEDLSFEDLDIHKLDVPYKYLTDDEKITKVITKSF